MKIRRETAFVNVGRGYRSKLQVRNNVERCYNAAPDADWGFAEIGEADPKFANEVELITSTFGATHRLFGLMHRTPVAVRKQIDRIITGSRAIKGCDGIEKWNPARYITETRISDRDYKLPVIRLNTHFPRHNTKNGADEQWDKLYDKLQERIYFWLYRGYIVEGSFDMNDTDVKKVKKLHPKLKVLVDAGIDYIWVVAPDDVKIRKGRERKVPMNIDGHNGHIVTYTAEVQ